TSTNRYPLSKDWGFFKQQRTNVACTCSGRLSSPKSVMPGLSLSRYFYKLKRLCKHLPFQCTSASQTILEGHAGTATGCRGGDFLPTTSRIAPLSIWI